MPILLELSDLLLTIFHNVLIVFNVLGWIPKRTRRLNLITLLCTAGSWFVLGYFYGMGYCFCTDWQWRIKEELGEQGLPASYITYLLRSQLGFHLGPAAVDILTGSVFAGALLASLALNAKDLIAKRRHPASVKGYFSQPPQNS